MMLVDYKCFGNDVETFVNLVGEFLVSLGKLLGKLFLCETMLDYTSGETVKINCYRLLEESLN
jgi:hypothetical protein